VEASQVPNGAESSTCGSRPEPITPIIGLRNTTGGGVPRCGIFVGRRERGAGKWKRRRRREGVEGGREGSDARAGGPVICGVGGCGNE